MPLEEIKLSDEEFSAAAAKLTVKRPEDFSQRDLGSTFPQHRRFFSRIERVPQIL
jgi:hypothetical protein